MVLAARGLASAGPLFHVLCIPMALYRTAEGHGTVQRIDDFFLLQDSQSRSISEAQGIEETDAESGSESALESWADSDLEADEAWDLGPAAYFSDHRAMLCTLPFCRTAGPDAPLLFVNEYTDGVGHRIRGIMSSISLASKLRMNFGGMLKSASDWVHGVQTSDAVKRWFDFDNVTQLYVNKYNRTGGHGRGKNFFPELEGPPRFDRVFMDERKLYAERDSIANGSSILLNAPRQGNIEEGERLSREIRAQIRRNLGSEPRTEFASAGVHVAIHVRRGDLSKKVARKLNSDEWFYHVAKRISAALACDSVPPEIDVWSSTERRDFWTAKDFKGFTDRGMAVHLDTSDILSPLAHFAFADVLVLPGKAKSHFSTIAAFVSESCIVSPINVRLYKEDLGVINPFAESFEHDLLACLSRTRKDWPCAPASAK